MENPIFSNIDILHLYSLANTIFRYFFYAARGVGFFHHGCGGEVAEDSFNAVQLVFYRNLVGLLFLSVSLMVRPVIQERGKTGWLVFRGFMGTIAFYTLLFCILHMPLGTAMTYNLTSGIFIALFSFLIFREYHGIGVLVAVLPGFTGMMMIYKPAMDLPGGWHLAGLLSGVTSAITYLTVGRLARYYDPRVIVLSFLLSGVVLPMLAMALHYLSGVPEDGLFVISFRLPFGMEWAYMLLLGLAALFGQYFVTRAYGSDKAGIVSAIGYANILFSVLLGRMLGDPFPDGWSLSGMACIIGSGVLIAVLKCNQAVARP